MKSKAAVKGGGELTRYEPEDLELYPEEIQVEGCHYYRFYCRPLWIVYEKYKNGVHLGYYVLPDQKEIFHFNSMITYVEKKTTGETLCVPCLR